MKGALVMANSTHGQTIESGVVADIAGYIPAAGVVDTGATARGTVQVALVAAAGNEIKALQSCGLPLGGDMVVRRKDAVYHYSGMSTCGSGWIARSAAAKIRYHRADEASRALVSALDQGMRALFVTRTIPHSAEDRLGVTLGLLAEGRRYVANQSVVKGASEAAVPGGNSLKRDYLWGEWLPSPFA